MDLNDCIDQLAMANSVCWYGHVLRRERVVVKCEVKCQWKRGRVRRTWKKEVVEESVKVGLRREDALCRSQWIIDINMIAAGLVLLLYQCVCIVAKFHFQYSTMKVGDRLVRFVDVSS